MCGKLQQWHYYQHAHDSWNPLELHDLALFFVCKLSKATIARLQVAPVCGSETLARFSTVSCNRNVARLHCC